MESSASVVANAVEEHVPRSGCAVIDNRSACSTRSMAGHRRGRGRALEEHALFFHLIGANDNGQSVGHSLVVHGRRKLR
jgi:hypothetical protein